MASQENPDAPVFLDNGGAHRRRNRRQLTQPSSSNPSDVNRANVADSPLLLRGGLEGARPWNYTNNNIWRRMSTFRVYTGVYRLGYTRTNASPRFADVPQKELDDLCAMCNEETINTCEHCNAVRYCSKVCADSDAALHQMCCAAYAAINASRDNHGVARAFLFPVGDYEAAGPVPCVMSVYGDTLRNKMRVKDWKKYLGVDGNDDKAEKQIECFTITRNPLRRRDLRDPGTKKDDFEFFQGHVLKVYARKNCKKLAPNKSLQAVATACGFEFNHLLRGPILVLREEISDGMIRNCDMQDLRDLIDFLRVYGTQDGQGLSKVDLVKKPVIGYRMSCWGEVQTGSSKPFEPVLIPEGHPLLRSGGDVSRVSKLLGLPLKLWKDTSSFSFDDMEIKGKAMSSNDGAVALQVICKEKSEFWGKTPEAWQGDVGDVLVVRKDGKDLDVQPLMTMIAFTKAVLLPKIEATMGGEGESRVAMRKNVVDFMKWENMMKFDEEVWEKRG